MGIKHKDKVMFEDIHLVGDEDKEWINVLKHQHAKAQAAMQSSVAEFGVESTCEFETRLRMIASPLELWHVDASRR